MASLTDNFFVMSNNTRSAVVRSARMERSSNLKKERACREVKLFYIGQEVGLLGHDQNTFKTFPIIPQGDQSPYNWQVCRKMEGFMIYTEDGHHWRVHMPTKTVHLESNSAQQDRSDIFQFPLGRQINPILDEEIVVKYNPTETSPVSTLSLTSDLKDLNTFFNIARG